MTFAGVRLERGSLTCGPVWQAGRGLARARAVLLVSLLLPAVAQAAPRKLDLLEFQVEGNTLLPQREVEAALYPFLGPDRTVEDAERARAALEELFIKRGYPTVSATLPPQDGSDGVVKIVVVQRTVGRLRVVGATYVAPSAIKSAAPSLAPGKVPQMTAVQNDLVAMNQLPDRTVTPSLKPGKTPDTVDVDLKVEDNLPLHGSLELNNRASPQTTPLRVVGSLSYDNMWGRGDTMTLGFQAAPARMNDAQVGTFGYTYRIPNSRQSLTASYINSNSNVSTGPSGNVIGKGQIAGLRWLTPFAASEGFTHSLNAGFDYKNLTQDVAFASTTTSSPIEYLPFTATYLASWTGSNNSTDASGSLIWAFGGIGSSAQDFDNKRLYAQPSFAYLKADFDHTHALPYKLEVYAHGQVQLAPSPLISSEQFSIGGLDSVRGYLESEALGDYGVAGQLELRSPPLARYIGAPINSLRAITFVDGGATKIRLPQAGQQSTFSMASVGVGASIRLLEHLAGEIDDAQVLLTGPTTKSGTNRVLFRLYGDF